MKSFFSYRISKFNVLITLFTLSATTFSFPATAVPPKVCVTTLGGDIACGTPVQKPSSRTSNSQSKVKSVQAGKLNGSGSSLIAVPALAANINGKWKGRYFCAQGFTGVTLTIKQNKTNITAEFELYPLPENPNVPKGVALYQGSFAPTSRQMMMKGVRWLKQPAPGWTIVDFSGKFDSQFRSFSGRKLNPNCGKIDLVRITGQMSSRAESYAKAKSLAI